MNNLKGAVYFLKSAWHLLKIFSKKGVFSNEVDS